MIFCQARSKSFLSPLRSHVYAAVIFSSDVYVRGFVIAFILLGLQIGLFDCRYHGERHLHLFDK
jgi:hypothetical protein